MVMTNKVVDAVVYLVLNQDDSSEPGRARQCSVEPGRAGQCSAEPGRAGQCSVEPGRAGQCRAVLNRDEPGRVASIEPGRTGFQKHPKTRYTVYLKPFWTI